MHAYLLTKRKYLRPSSCEILSVNSLQDRIGNVGGELEAQVAFINEDYYRDYRQGG
jgi:hypothetical protein